MSTDVVIAVDGPSASGKGTISRRLAAHYRLPHLDTGLLYRAVGHAVLARGGDPADAEQAEAVARTLDLALLADGQLRSEAVGSAASKVAVHSGVRQALLGLQRRFARQPGGAVLDGRDIGTVIVPQASAKLFVTASPATRALRRHAELRGTGQAVALEAVLAEIEARDARDSSRSDAPLRAAPDALLLDTTDLDIERAVQLAVELVDQQIGSRA